MPEKQTSGRYSAEGCGLWTKEEHKRFMSALEIYPNGPWKKVSELVGTRNPRQTMTHAQKHRQKIARHERGLRPRKKAEHGDDVTPNTSKKSLSPSPSPSSSTPPKPRSTSVRTFTSAGGVPSRANKSKATWQTGQGHPHAFHDAGWMTTASPVDVSDQSYPPADHSFSPHMSRVDAPFGGHAFPDPNNYSCHLVPHTPYFRLPPPPYTPSVSTHAIDPLPLGAVGDEWIDDCYDLFVGAIV